MSIKSILAVAASAALLTACSNMEELSGSNGTTPLSLNFGIAGETQSRAVVSTVSANEIGLFLRQEISTAGYDGTNYENFQYSESNKPMLSSTDGLIFGYYPYADGNTNPQEISMTSTNAQTDYMYASAAAGVGTDLEAVTCSDHDCTKTVYMHHAKSVIELIIKRGSYSKTDEVKVTKVTVGGTATENKLTDTGTLNALTGEVTPGTEAKAIEVNSGASLGTSANPTDATVEALVVSMSDAEQTVPISILLSDNATLTGSAKMTVTPEHKNSLTITLPASGSNLSVSDNNKNEWSSNSFTVTMSGKTITVNTATDANIVYNVAKNSSTNIVITAKCITDDYGVAAPTIPSGCTATNSSDHGIVTTTITAATSDATITYDKVRIKYNGHEMVDLGLTSGTKWATCNVGAATPSEYGKYYAWGETTAYGECPSGSTEPKIKYNHETYTYHTSTTTLPSTADAATVNWGYDNTTNKGWRMPTKGDIEELINGTYYGWTSSYESTGIKGYIFYKKVSGKDSFASYSTSDVHIFLPASGYHYWLTYASSNSNLDYWSSTHVDSSSYSYICFGAQNTMPKIISTMYSCYALTIRPVYGSITQ